MNKILKSILLIFTLLFFIGLTSCKTTSNKRIKGGETLTRTEGWKNKNTYELVVIGIWDRTQYYTDGQEVDEDKIYKPIIGLQADAKRAAQLVAMRNFKAKMGEYIQSQTGVEEGRLISDTIDSSLEGVSINPHSIKENYTPQNDCRVTFQFTANNLKNVIDKIATDILKKKS